APRPAGPGPARPPPGGETPPPLEEAELDVPLRVDPLTELRANRVGRDRFLRRHRPSKRGGRGRAVARGPSPPGPPRMGVRVERRAGGADAAMSAAIACATVRTSPAATSRSHRPMRAPSSPD